MLAVPLDVASERSDVSKPPPWPAAAPIKGAATVIEPEPLTWEVVMPVLYPVVPATNVLLVPGVVEPIVAEAVAELRPVEESFAHTDQPFLALVFTVAVRGVGLLVTLEVDSTPRGSVLPLNANEKTEGTLAVTTTWSSLMLAVAYELVSISAGAEVRVVTVPVFDEVAELFTLIAAEFVQLKQ